MAAVGLASTTAAGGAIGLKAGQALTNALFSEGSGSGGASNPNQYKRLSDGEIDKLKENGFDIHDLKGGKKASQFDLFKDKQGEIYRMPKRGGEADPLGMNINDF